MPYGLILLIVLVLVTGRFVIASGASTRAKSVVAIACVSSIVAPLVLPQWHLVSLLTQVMLVIGLVLHSKVHG